VAISFREIARSEAERICIDIQRTAEIFLWEKRNQRYFVSMSPNDHNPFTAPGLALRAAAQAKSLEMDVLGF
jgi:hypothetical protein